MPAEFQRFCPYSAGMKLLRDAFTMYALMASESNANVPWASARTDFKPPGVDPIGCKLTSARARGLLVRFSTTTPRMTAACRETAAVVAARQARKLFARLILNRILLQVAILPADALSSASKPAEKPACSQDWLPHKRCRIAPRFLLRRVRRRECVVKLYPFSFRTVSPRGRSRLYPPGPFPIPVSVRVAPARL